MAAQHKASLRTSLRSALAHRRAANEIIDSLADTQEKFNTAMDKLNVDLAGAVAEVSTATFPAETGNFQVATLTAPTGAAAGQGDFILLESGDGNTYAVWLDIDAAGVAPNGPIFSAADVPLEVDILSSDTAAQVATKIFAVTDASLGNIVSVDNLDGTLEFTSDDPGVLTWETYSEDEATDGSMSIVIDTAGAASNYGGTYFFINSANDAVEYYVWFQLNGYHPDPSVVGKTGIQINNAVGATGANVATAVEAALDATLDFSAVRTVATLAITNAGAGASTDISEETSPLTAVSTVTQGSDADVSLETDYEADAAVTDLLDVDEVRDGAQHKSTLRKSMQSALSHRRLANLICDAMEELQANYNAMLVKLDAEGGTLNDTNYEATLGVDAINPDEISTTTPHKSSLRKSLRSALAENRLADTIIDGISDLQSSFNDVLAQIDSGVLFGQTEEFKVDVIDPDEV